MTFQEIAEKLAISTSTVRLCISKYNKGGVDAAIFDMYRKQARKNYLALAKAKKRSTKKIRATIYKQLTYIKRDISNIVSARSRLLEVC